MARDASDIKADAPVKECRVCMGIAGAAGVEVQQLLLREGVAGQICGIGERKRAGANVVWFTLVGHDSVSPV